MPEQSGSMRTSAAQMRRLHRVLALVAAGWSVLILASFTRSWVQHHQHAQALARQEARSRFATDMAYRRWVIRLGGVYVPVRDDTPPNPYLALANVPERDIRTPSGKLLTLVNSSYMTRQVAALTNRREGLHEHITSLKPLRPENAADPWETSALKALEAGRPEVSSIEWQEGRPYMRLMRPMITQASCLKCHEAQGYRVGDVRGGISVTVPMRPYQTIMRAELTNSGAAHGLLWTLGLLGLSLSGRRLRRGILDREQAEAQQAALREQLHQSQKMEAIGQLASGVAHDFNNLLTVILLNLDIVETRLPANPLVQEAAGTVRSAAEQASALTRSLLIFSRRLPMEKKAAKLQDITQTATRMLRRLLPASIEVTTDVEPEPALWVNADTTQLQQVILNLAINARDAMPEGGTLRIRVRADGTAGPSAPASACLAVSDTGVGIPDEIRPRLFEPFFSTKPRGQGTGLGLAIIKSIVEDHDGYIRIESKLGQGTTFTLVLPCTAPPPAIWPAREAAPLRRGGGEAILLAEDNQFVRDSVVSLLQELGYQVISTTDGRSAVQQWRAQRDQVRLLILDVDLPGRTGAHCLQDLRAEGASAPAILISGRADWNGGKSAQAGAVLLRKPFKADELAELVHRLLHPSGVREPVGGTG